MPEFKIKRIYQKAEEKDGIRILVDGLWPRGIKKENAKIDIWLKEIAPSSDLRKHFHHQHGKWTKFRQYYFKELDLKGDLVQKLSAILKEHNITLLYSSRDEIFNNAVVLKEYLEQHIS